MKRKYFITICLFVCALCAAQSTDEVVERYIKYFINGEIKTKIEVVKEAITLQNPDMGPFYHVVIDFARNNPDEMNKDLSLWKTVENALYEIKKLSYRESRNSVLRLFLDVKNSTIQIAALEALSKIGKGDKQLIANLNTWLDTENWHYIALQRPDNRIIKTCIVTLGALGDKTSFPPIFLTILIQYSDDITKTAIESLLLLEGNLKDNLINIILTYDVFNKRGALEFALESKYLDDDAKKEISKVALTTSVTMKTLTANEQKILADMQYLSIIAVSKYKLGDMTGIVIEHFNKMKFEFENNKDTNIHLIECIECLGNMATHEAAVALADYLDYANLVTGKNVFDEHIVLTLINNLVKLGDKVAIDPLQYAAFLNYSNKIKLAAKEAVAALNGK